MAVIFRKEAAPSPDRVLLAGIGFDSGTSPEAVGN